MSEPVVIVGAGLACYNLARELRAMARNLDDPMWSTL